LKKSGKKKALMKIEDGDKLGQMNEFMSPACPLNKKKIVSSFGKDKDSREAHMSRIDE